MHLQKNIICKCYRIGNIFIYLYMRVIAAKTLKEYIREFHQAEHALLSWYDEAILAEWNNSAELKMQYKNASILSNKRVVFNIHGNTYRLIVAIEYRLKIVFVVWLGTHKQYDNIDAKTISYVKAN
jgi:mRNA interferase HigB